jgi:hypothetical protein
MPGINEARAGSIPTNKTAAANAEHQFAEQAAVSSFSL